MLANLLEALAVQEGSNRGETSVRETRLLDLSGLTLALLPIIHHSFYFSVSVTVARHLKTKREYETGDPRSINENSTLSKASRFR